VISLSTGLKFAFKLMSFASCKKSGLSFLAQRFYCKQSNLYILLAILTLTKSTITIKTS